MVITWYIPGKYLVNTRYWYILGCNMSCYYDYVLHHIRFPLRSPNLALKLARIHWAGLQHAIVHLSVSGCWEIFPTYVILLIIKINICLWKCFVQKRKESERNVQSNNSDRRRGLFPRTTWQYQAQPHFLFMKINLQVHTFQHVSIDSTGPRTWPEIKTICAHVPALVLTS